MFQLLSLLFTAVMLVIAFVILFSGPKRTYVKKNAKTDSTEGNEGKMYDEVHDKWYYFGFVDDAPNVIRQVVAGSEKTGGPQRYFGKIDYGVVDPKTGKVYLKGKIPEDYHEFEDGNGFFKPILRFIRQRFGKRWYGIPFISNVKSLNIDRVVSKATNANQDSLSDELESKSVRRYGYYGEILRPTLHRNSDSEDNVRFSFISYAVLRIMDFAPAFNIYSDNLLIMVSKVISGFISKSTFKMSYDVYKDKGTKLSPEQILELETTLSAIVPFMVIEFSMGDPELHPEIQDAMQQKAIAKQKADARRAEGEGEKDYKISISVGAKQSLINEGEGEKEKLKAVAEGKAQRVLSYYEKFKEGSFSHADALAKAQELVAREFEAEAMGKLQGTFAPGASFMATSHSRGEDRK